MWERCRGRGLQFRQNRQPKMRFRQKRQYLSLPPWTSVSSVLNLRSVFRQNRQPESHIAAKTATVATGLAAGLQPANLAHRYRCPSSFRLPMRLPSPRRERGRGEVPFSGKNGNYHHRKYLFPAESAIPLPSSVPHLVLRQKRQPPSSGKNGNRHPPAKTATAISTCRPTARVLHF